MAFALGARMLGLRDRYAGLLLASMAVTGAVAAVAATSMQESPPPRPVVAAGDGFVTSNACRACHPSEYSSWHDSYHRRMTQAADLQSLGAPELRQGRRLQVEATGRTVELFA